MTRFDYLLANMTVEQLANITVKAVVINNSEYFYVTTSGQLYPMTKEGFKLAVDHEKQFWSQEHKEITNNDNN